MRIISLILALSFSGQAFSMSLMEKRERCFSLLVNEFQSVLASDNGLVRAQLTLTGMKLAQLLSDTTENKKSLENYSRALVDEKFIVSLNEDSKALEKIASMYRNYRGKEKLASSDRVEVFRSLGELLRKEKVSDQDAGALMASMMTTPQKGEVVFNENDFAIAWFANQVSRNFDGNDSYFLSELVSAAFEAKGEKLIAKNLARSQLKIKARLAAIKERVFEANRRYCLSDYKDQWNGQNRSVFQGCRAPEEEILNLAFLDSVQDILQGAERVGYETELSLLPGKDRKLRSDQIRAVQDYLNSDKFTDKERVLEYYKRGIYPDDEKCQTFTMVDKKNQTTSVYTVDGEEIFTTNSIQAQPRDGESQVVFNEDAILKKFENGTYTRTTSAGVYYTILDMPPEERAKRLYHEEFDDRVFVISPRYSRGEAYVYDDRTTMAIHGVPINGWVDNANQRLESFEGKNRNLSTGCVNLEAYAFDLMSNLSQNRCPVYILPEDQDNYFFIKNREVMFSSADRGRRSGTEPAKRCKDGLVKLKESKSVCEGGEWIEDPENVNTYYFSELSRDKYHQDVEVSGWSASVQRLWGDRKRLIEKVVANNIDGEDFEDLVALVHGSGADEREAEARFKDLYNAYYTLREKQGVVFDRMNVEQKRKTILDYYLDPKGFQRDREEEGKQVYAPIERNKTSAQIIEGAKDVRFIHGY